MNKTIVVLSIAAASFGFAPLVRAADHKKAAAEDAVTITLDVAMDASSVRANRPDWSISGPLRGDTFVSGGLIYAGESIPDGDTTATFTPSDDSRLGALVARGQYIADGAEIASGARHSVASTHIFMLDEGSGVVTEGLEGNGTEVRAVVGGYGKYSGATGQVKQEIVGSNGTAGSNLRFTFTLNVASGQEPTELMQRRAFPRRH